MLSAKLRPVVLIDFPVPTFLSVTEPVPVIDIDSPETSPIKDKSELTTFVVPSYCLEPDNVIDLAVISNVPESKV